MNGLYIAPAFVEKLVVHLAKNFMSLPNIKVIFGRHFLGTYHMWSDFYVSSDIDFDGAVYEREQQR
jgi:hypothetical protein